MQIFRYKNKPAHAYFNALQRFCRSDVGKDEFETLAYNVKKWETRATENLKAFDVFKAVGHIF